jgi:hypothetical protein
MPENVGYKLSRAKFFTARIPGARYSLKRTDRMLLDELDFESYILNLELYPAS